MKTDRIFYVIAVLLVLLSAHVCWGSEVTATFLANDTSWDVGFNDLQTPGWVADPLGGHPGGSFGIAYKLFYAEIGGDPHRPREATTVVGGIRHDIVHFRRLHFYGQGGVGMLMAPSFLEYCGSYEYRNGDCGAGNEDPEFCWWFMLHAGVGLNLHLPHGITWEIGRFEYYAPYAISPRYRVSTGVSFCIAGCPK